MINEKHSEEVESIIETNSILEEDTNYEVHYYYLFIYLISSYIFSTCLITTLYLFILSKLNKL